MKLSIIIVNYKSRIYLEKCLASIFAKINSNLPFEVIVVNNGAKEETVGLAQAFPGIEIVQSLKNTGFGSANNLGAKVAQGEVLFFLNPDAEIGSVDISAVIAEFEEDRNLGILGSRVVCADGNVQRWTAGEKMNLWSIVRNNFKLSRDKKIWLGSQKKAVFWVAGTAMFIRKELFTELEGFDEQFFMYFEDVDLCRRALLSGKRVLYFPDFFVLHHGGKSFSQKRAQKSHYYQSQDYYFKKHRGYLEALFLRILRFFSF